MIFVGVDMEGENETNDKFHPKDSKVKDILAPSFSIILIPPISLAVSPRMRRIPFSSGMFRVSRNVIDFGRELGLKVGRSEDI